MASPESLLAKAAEDGSFPEDEWPATLQWILDRLPEIVDDFPKPPAPPAPTTAGPAQSLPSPTASQNADAEVGDKENAPPRTPPRRPIPASEGSPRSQSESQIPPETVAFYNSIRATLAKLWPKHPPHTIQRLAELILTPRRHYRHLPQYLRALDRVVNVSSPASFFPLPQAVLPNTGGLLNGTAPAPPSSLGSDESLGGALLTPIPWLQNRGSQSELISESTEMVDGPNGTGRIETVSVVNGQLASTPADPQPQIASSHPDGESLPSTGPVTQGEILRQEQEAGVLLSNPHSVPPHRLLRGESNTGPSIVETVEGGDEAPHARGPELIGDEDIGPQRSAHHLDIEGAVGRPSIERASKSPGPGPDAGPDVNPESTDQEMKDSPDEASSDGANKDDQDKDTSTHMQG